jgi:hypothetical protein
MFLMGVVEARQRRALGVVAFGLFTLWPAVSFAQDVTKPQCVSAYTDGQRHRRSGELLSARADLRVCASDPCPAMLQNDCAAWLAEVDHLLPTVVFAARDASGRDLVDVAVVLDGQPLVARLDGRLVDVDPGEHVVRFEEREHEAVEQHLLVREGEKARSVSVTMNPIARSAAGRSTEDAPERTRPIPMGTWILGGISALAFATAGGATLADLPTWSRCHTGGCTQSDRSLSDSLNTVGTVGLAVGAVSLVAAAYFFITRPTVSREPRVVLTSASHAPSIAF